VGHRERPEVLEKKKLLPLSGFEHRIVQPTTYTVYRLRGLLSGKHTYHLLEH
jgi:hypothetical protein